MARSRSNWSKVAVRGFAAAGAGEHAQADDPGGALIGIGAEGVGEALNFLEGQEPLACGFGALAEAGRWIVGPHFPSDGEAEHLAQHLAHPVCPYGRRLEGLRRNLRTAVQKFATEVAG